jgi:hypothetical protein
MVFRFFEGCELWFCAVGFVWLAGFKKMFLGGLGARKKPPIHSCEATPYAVALRLDRLEGDAHLRKCSTEAF